MPQSRQQFLRVFPSKLHFRPVNPKKEVEDILITLVRTMVNTRNSGTSESIAEKYSQNKDSNANIALTIYLRNFR